MKTKMKARGKFILGAAILMWLFLTALSNPVYAAEAPQPQKTLGPAPVTVIANGGYCGGSFETPACDCGYDHEPGDYWHGLGSPVYMGTDGLIHTVDLDGNDIILPGQEESPIDIGPAIYMDSAGNLVTVDSFGAETIIEASPCECGRVHAPGDYWHGLGSPVYMGTDGLIHTVDLDGNDIILPGQEESPIDIGPAIHVDGNGNVVTVDSLGTETVIGTFVEPILAPAVSIDKNGNMITVAEDGAITVVAPGIDFVTGNGDVITTCGAPVSGNIDFDIVDGNFSIVGDDGFVLPVNSDMAFRADFLLNVFYKVQVKYDIAMVFSGDVFQGYIDLEMKPEPIAADGSVIITMVTEPKNELAGEFEISFFPQ